MNTNKLVDDIKYNLLYYLRFKRQYIPATEVNYNYNFIADILAFHSSTDYTLEIEIKINQNDLYNDINKSYLNIKKHDYIKLPYYKLGNHIPNYFYYCIDEKLNTLKNIDFINNINNNYGIIVYNTKDRFKRLTIIKKSKLIHNGKDDLIKKNIILRLSSEIVNYYKKITDMNYH